jgi:hypothetical protein
MRMPKVFGGFLVLAGAMLMLVGSTLVPVNSAVWADIEPGDPLVCTAIGGGPATHWSHCLHITPFCPPIQPGGFTAFCLPNPQMSCSCQ